MEQLLDIAAFGGIDDELLEDLIIHNINRPRNIHQGGLAIRRLDLNQFTNEECRLYFRFDKMDLRRLVEALHIPPRIVTGHRYSATDVEGLCIYLWRLAYPNRLSDLEALFGVSSSYLSAIANAVMNIIDRNKGHLLTNLANLTWLDRNKLQYYADAVSFKGAPIRNCWGFIDGTARPICRPSLNQAEYYSGHKRQHCVKYQSVLSPDGLIVNLCGAYPGRRHDAGIFRESLLYNQLEHCAMFPNRERYVLYGDCAYPIRELLLCPFSNRNLTPQQQAFNTHMSSLRQAVEWGFGKIVSEFAFLDFKKNNKLLLQDISKMYSTATILTNCHTCLYGSQTSHYFNTAPPALDVYLCNRND